MSQRRRKPRCIAARFAGAALSANTASTSGTANDLPRGFVHLSEIDATILQDIQYATSANFTGAKVTGYDGASCILMRNAALALQRIQESLQADGLGLKVYDCYRPYRAVLAFVAWVQRGNSTGLQRYYPRVPRRELIHRGYISSNSRHSQGVAVDLTLVPRPLDVRAMIEPSRSYGPCTAATAEREPDESLEMGTGYDCFDPKSGSGAAIDATQRANRKRLADAMAAQGYQPMRNEWWHFTYTRMPAGLPHHDTPVVAAPNPSRN